MQGSLFPMCGMNLAFNRELIGPAMYFGLMGEGYPIGRYDDMWAGWCVKVGSICNYLPWLCLCVYNCFHRYCPYAISVTCLPVCVCTCIVAYHVTLPVKSYQPCCLVSSKACHPLMSKCQSEQRSLCVSMIFDNRKAARLPILSVILMSPAGDL